MEIFNQLYNPHIVLEHQQMICMSKKFQCRS